MKPCEPGLEGGPWRGFEPAGRNWEYLFKYQTSWPKLGMAKTKPKPSSRMFQEYRFERSKSTDQKFKAKTRILGECRVFSIYLRWSHVFALSSGDKVLVAKPSWL